MRIPAYLITDDSYKPLGAIIESGGRWIGLDTKGQPLFDRKNLSGAEAACKKIGRMVTTAWYGIDHNNGRVRWTAGEWR